MTPLERYDEAMKIADQHRRNARQQEKHADNIEAAILKQLGIEEHSREPGFANWKIKGVPGYYFDPRLAVKELTEIQKAEAFIGSGI